MRQARTGASKESIPEENDQTLIEEKQWTRHEKRRSEKEARAKKERCAEEKSLIKEERMRKESAPREAKSAETEPLANKRMDERGSDPKL